MISAILLAIENEEERLIVSEIFRRYFPYMQSAAYNILKSKEDAEDAAMSAIEKIADDPMKYADYKSSDVQHIIICIVKNKAIDLYRRKQRQNQRFVSTDVFEGNIEEPYEEDVVDMLINEENKQALVKALLELDEKYRDPIILYYNDGLKSAEIAEILGVDKAYVNVLIKRGRNKLKEILVKEGFTYEQK